MKFKKEQAEINEMIFKIQFVVKRFFCQKIDNAFFIGIENKMQPMNSNVDFSLDI